MEVISQLSYRRLAQAILARLARLSFWYVGFSEFHDTTQVHPFTFSENATGFGSKLAVAYVFERILLAMPLLLNCRLLVHDVVSNYSMPVRCLSPYAHTLR